ncbi:MAG TPA: hypothetical protein VNJ07_06535, partial [Chitinophagales bacterium]|nr:hypothetical protein [Chitinophagales bacterium]
MFRQKYNKSLLPIAFTALMVFSGCGKDESDLTDSLIAYISTADHNYGEIYTCAMNGSGAQRISELGAKNLSDS